MYRLNNTQIRRLQQGIRVVFAIPFIDDLEDYIWEALFAYVKDIPLVDPLENIRSKRLFDVVDVPNRRGWSLKALQWSIRPECEFELVIQRADIFKKYEPLGFRELTLETHPAILGEALLKHWHDKVETDAMLQNIDEKRIGILLKSRDRRSYAFYEDDLKLYAPNELTWQWTDATKTGLQGRRKTDSFCVYRWYPNQKQFFERFQLPPDAVIFNIEPRRLPLENIIPLLLTHLDTF